MNEKIITLDGIVSKQIDPEGLQWPDNALVSFVINADENKIIGRLGTLALAHAEGFYVAEGQDKKDIANKLLSTVEDNLKQVGTTVSHVFVLGNDLESETILAKAGYKRLPVKIYHKFLE